MNFLCTTAMCAVLSALFPTSKGLLLVAGCSSSKLQQQLLHESDSYCHLGPAQPTMIYQAVRAQLVRLACDWTAHGRDRAMPAAVDQLRLHTRLIPVAAVNDGVFVGDAFISQGVNMCEEPMHR